MAVVLMRIYARKINVQLICGSVLGKAEYLIKKVP